MIKNIFVFFVVMKGFYISIFLLFSVCATLKAQEIDTIPINTKDLNIKLKRSPLPSRIGTLLFKPVKIEPQIVNSKVNYWKTKTSVGINLNQAAFSNNWSGGGVNSLALAGIINYKAEYSKESYSYVTEVILNYGKVKNKDQMEKKTVDRIYWDNKAAIQISKNWYFFGSVTFESQFDKGFAYSTNNGQEVATLTSKFMSPGYLTESVGFEYKPTKYFSTRLGTGSARQTFVLDNDELFRAYDEANPGNPGGKTDSYGVERGKTFRNDLGFQIVMNFDKDIFPNINLKSKYMVLIPYENVGYMNHRLDVALTAKVNRFMSTTLTGVGLYDRNTSSKVQGSQTLALGVVFVFPR
ncbi:DUF3078 domain-containing protein [Pedobacter nutrimenti]|uniref:DUF3078 domain-containing protein n=1 Tax=Pedobacter nutrimenti TaxID=1241337 RepID=UPI00292F6974|nr:DUF3078 domain-containing protein [Pedobacter nutrimenti]